MLFPSYYKIMVHTPAKSNPAALPFPTNVTHYSTNRQINLHRWHRGRQNRFGRSRCKEGKQMNRLIRQSMHVPLSKYVFNSRSFDQSTEIVVLIPKKALEVTSGFLNEHLSRQQQPRQSHRPTPLRSPSPENPLLPSHWGEPMRPIPNAYLGAPLPALPSAVTNLSIREPPPRRQVTMSPSPSPS